MKIDNKIIDVGLWQELSWLHSGGTRNKKILSDSGKLYYFKESYKKGETKFYKYEFYSEVIASFIGEMIGLDVLEYNIAIYKNKIGCLSKSMISGDEELIEAGKYLKAFDNTFMFDNENPKDKYTFQLIIKALDAFSLTINVDKLIDVIIFDSIIGNSDRHQENWGFIAKNTLFSESIDELEKVLLGKNTKYTSLINGILSLFNAKSTDKKSLSIEATKIKLKSTRDIHFSPIYDSGCCLGRELTEERISKLLTDNNLLNSYIQKGVAEIHWEGKKQSHFDLLITLIENNGYKIRERIKELINRFDFKKFSDFILTLDDNIPQQFDEYRISDNRKDFIVKLVTLRIETLQKLTNE